MDFIPVYQPCLKGNELDYVEQCVKSSWISSKGSYISKFEQSFADYLGIKYAVGTNTGTSACHLSCIATGMGPGDEVIVPNLSFVATANAVKYCGAKPIFIDIDKNSWNLNINLLENVITSKTRSVFPVHLFGNPCDMDRIIKFCDYYGVNLIEDCAEAIGAKYKNKLLGTFSQSAAFSFFGNKHITCGEGGMIVTNDKLIYDKIQLYKGQGQTSIYYHKVVGYNYRMTNLQAALGAAQLERIEYILLRKREIFQTYQKLLSNFVGQYCSPENLHGNWMFSCLVKNRKKLQQELARHNIDSRRMFYPINQLPPYRDGKRYPVSEFVSKHGIVLPSYPDLTDDQLSYICGVVNKYAEPIQILE